MAQSQYDRQREIAEAQRKRDEERRVTQLHAQLRHAPAGVLKDSWILWRPGVDPEKLYAQSESSKRARRLAAVTAGTLGILLTVAAAVYSIALGFSSGFWWGLLSVLLSLVIGSVAVIFIWDSVSRTSTQQSARFNEWVKAINGTDCFAAWPNLGGPFDSTDSAARRVVLAARRIARSYALQKGWLPSDTLARAHDDAWISLVRANSATPSAREKHLAEVAKSLEAVVQKVQALDNQLRARESNEELEALQRDYLALRDRAAEIGEEVDATRRFLDQHPE